MQASLFGLILNAIKVRSQGKISKYFIYSNPDNFCDANEKLSLKQELLNCWSIKPVNFEHIHIL